MPSIAPYDPIRSPAPKPPRHSLLKRAFDLDAADGDDSLIPPPRVHYPNAVHAGTDVYDGPENPEKHVDINKPVANQRWQGGFSFYPESCGNGLIWVPCGVANTSAVTDAEAIQSYIPTAIQVDITRSAVNREVVDFQGRAVRFLDGVQHRVAGHEFWYGTKAIAEGLPNNYLKKAPLTDLGLAASSRTALALAQTYLDGAGIGGWGFIHTSKRVVDEWLSDWLVQDIHTDPENVQIYDAFGNEIIADPGYPSAAEGGSGWEIYVTGPVYAKLSGLEIIPDNISDALNRATNSLEYRAQRNHALVWDGCAHAKVQIALT